MKTGVKEMHLNTYQLEAAEFAQYGEPMYPVASLMVEAAELGDLFIKPWLRGDNKDIDRQEVLSEAGDCLWMLSMICSDQGVTLQEVAEYNLKKLRDRRERGVIQGQGGNR
jgi:NTP pyrophosphatase (non-canonical NTP hydrolase)